MYNIFNIQKSFTAFQFIILLFLQQNFVFAADQGRSAESAKEVNQARLVFEPNPSAITLQP